MVKILITADEVTYNVFNLVFATWLNAVKKFCQNCMVAFPSPVLLRARIGDIIWHRRNVLKKAKSKPAVDPVTQRPVIDLSYFKLGDDLKNFLAISIPEALPDDNSVDSGMFYLFLLQIPSHLHIYDIR
jgi:hypothetical protein